MTTTPRRVFFTGYGAGDYHVISVTVVDRPWLRDTTYPVVPEGFKIITTGRFATQGAAVREFERLLGGRDDFASEYVSVVGVESWRSYRRTIRRDVGRQRARDLSTQELRMQALACHAYRVGNTFKYLTAEWDQASTWDDLAAPAALAA